MLEDLISTRTQPGETADERDDAARGHLAASSRTAAPRRQLFADVALLLVTLIWGATFVMVKDAVSAFPVFSFMALRFAFAALVLLPFVVLRRASPPGPLSWRSAFHRQERGSQRAASLHLRSVAPLLFRVSAPLLIGGALFAGYAFQTFGLQLTTPAKAGFITGLSVVIVPLFAALLLHQPPSRNAWLGVGLATIGLGLLSLTTGFRVQLGDLLVLGCAVSFAAHILLTGHFAPRHDPLLLTLGQVVAGAFLNILAACLFDAPVPVTRQVIFAAAFTGLLATAAAFGIQTVAQRFTTPTHTALIFAAEPVFAGLFSFLLIGELLGPRQVIGCGLILAGMVVAEMRRNA